MSIKIFRHVLTKCIVLAIISCHREVDKKTEGEKLKQTSRDWSESSEARVVEKILM